MRYLFVQQRVVQSGARRQDESKDARESFEPVLSVLGAVRLRCWTRWKLRSLCHYARPSDLLGASGSCLLRFWMLGQAIASLGPSINSYSYANHILVSSSIFIVEGVEQHISIPCIRGQNLSGAFRDI